jgi:hypothetical protein
VVALCVGWIGVQSLERLVKRLPRGSDVLACWMCDDRGGCHCALRAARHSDEGKGGGK